MAAIPGDTAEEEVLKPLLAHATWEVVQDGQRSWVKDDRDMVSKWSLKGV